MKISFWLAVFGNQSQSEKMLMVTTFIGTNIRFQTLLSTKVTRIRLKKATSSLEEIIAKGLSLQ